jgi:hypothetical protein
VDLGHVRDLADTTRFIASKVIALQKDGGAVVLRSEGGVRRVRVLPAGEHFPDVELAVMVALCAAYDFAVWHEVFTWFRLERHSSFSPEDNFSNLLGCWVGAKACLRSDRQYNTAVDSTLIQTLTLLGAQTREVALDAIEAVNGLWFDRNDDLTAFVFAEIGPAIPFFSETPASNKRLLRRHLVPLPSVTPWLISDLHGKKYTVSDSDGALEEITIDFDLGTPKPVPSVLGLPEATTTGLKVADFYDIEIEVDKNKVPEETFALIPNAARFIRRSDLQLLVNRVRAEVLSEYPHGDEPI